MEPYYRDDHCTIYHGEAFDVLGMLPTKSCDVLMTDPPYSSGGMFRTDRVKAPEDKYNVITESTFGGDNRDQWSWLRWVAAWTSEALRVVRVGGHAFVFSDWRQLPACTDAIQWGGWAWRGILVWDKTATRPALGKFYQTLEFIAWATNGAATNTRDTPTALFTESSVRGSERTHTTQKPVALMNHILRVVPDSENATILDPFMGSGSTLAAAKYTGRKAIGIEIEERYCEIAAQRLAQEVLPFAG